MTPKAAGAVLDQLHTFSIAPYGLSGALVQGSDGNFYGTIPYGGSGGYGTIFKMTPSGSLTTLVSLQYGATNGFNPSGALVQGGDGNFYGTTQSEDFAGYGTVFKMTPSGALTTLASFQYDFTNGYYPNGSHPQDALVQGGDGNFYGTTQTGGLGNNGTVFKMTPSGTLTTLVSFGFTNGSFPQGGLVQGNDGNFYGTTQYGGLTNDPYNSYGTIFKITPSGTLTTLVLFNSTNGANPNGGLVQGGDGNFYGTTQNGGGVDPPQIPGGTVFKMTPSGTLTTLISFAYTNGENPNCGLVQGNDGNFYGTTQNGGTNGWGTVFKMTPTGALTTLASFKSYDKINGYNPAAALVLGNDGNFYGTTQNGGPGGRGTIFKMSAEGTFTSLVSLPGDQGYNPTGGLVQGPDGDFYGTTLQGGAKGDYGTIFKISPLGKTTTLYSFDLDSTNGYYPQLGLTLGRDGNFYGTTLWGGTNGTGTVYKITPAGVLTYLVSFNHKNLGDAPVAPLTLSRDGNFYGTTVGGGTNGCGNVFKMTSAGVMTNLASFNGTNGYNPASALVQGRDGNLSRGEQNRTVPVVSKTGQLVPAASL